MSRFRSVVAALSALLVVAATLTVLTPPVAADDEEPPGPWLMFRSVDIAGDFVAGQTLHGSFRTWNGDFAAVELHWVRCDVFPYDPDGVTGSCNGIADATGESYELSDDDVGSYVALYAVGHNDEGQQISAQYGQPGILVEPRPAVLGTPTLPDGDLYAGDPVDVTLSGYVPDPIDPTYTWLACTLPDTNSPEDGCAEIDGASGSTFTPTTELVGKYLVAMLATGSPGDLTYQYTDSSGRVSFRYGDDLAPEFVASDDGPPVAGETVTFTASAEFDAYFALRGESSDVVTASLVGCASDDSCIVDTADATAPGGPWTVTIPGDWA
ncbi:MAG: hypothetical protein ACYC2O_10600, partial [Microthrixaceae bacterium]